jgi:hypothetical protein
MLHPKRNPRPGVLLKSPGFVSPVPQRFDRQPGFGRKTGRRSHPPPSSSMSVGKKRIGRALARNVILSDRVPTIIAYPLLPNEAPEEVADLFFYGCALLTR